jgi:hypothetical protein
MTTIKVRFKTHQAEEKFLISTGTRFIRTGLRDYFVSSFSQYLMDPVKYVIYLDQNCQHKLGMWSGEDLIVIKDREVSIEYFDKLEEILSDH